MNSTTNQASEFEFPVIMHREGRSGIFVPKISLTSTTPPMNPAFYNPLGEYKRDVMVHMVSSYAVSFTNGVRFADILAGVGAGGIRVGNESRNVGRVFLNDLNPNAMQLASLSINQNGIGEKFTKSGEEANFFLSNHSSREERFDIIDIDPFGSPTPYLDSALRALNIGGILCATSTDGQILCGLYPNVSLRKYGGYSLNTDYCQEIAIRLMLGSLAFAASRHNLGISPTFAHTEKHYTRIYAMVTDNSADLDGRLGFISQCNSCPSRSVGPLMIGVCPDCRSTCKAAGPLWIGELFDLRMLTKAVELRPEGKLEQMFIAAREEVELPATFYVTDSITSLIGSSSVPIAYAIDSLKGLGYKSSRTILNKKGFRTDACTDDIIAVFLSFRD